LIAPRLAERWGQPVVIENRAGAAGNLGAAEAARAAPDGYTLLMAVSTIAATPGLGQNVGYVLEHDLTATAMVATTAMVVAVHPEVPAKSLTELIALARGRPGKLAYSTCGNASPMHLAGELLKLSAGIDLIHAPYKGCTPALTDVVGGTVPIAFNTIANVAQFERAGRVRTLAVASPRRHADFPQVPTVAEQGVAGYEADVWFGLFAPAQVPAAVLDTVNAGVNRALAEADVRERLRAQFFDARPDTPAAFQKFVRDETAKWTRTIRDAQIKPD
jgi:tripartite-type tricarboxylate transporter receptor subunit TctC